MFSLLCSYILMSASDMHHLPPSRGMPDGRVGLGMTGIQTGTQYRHPQRPLVASGISRKGRKSLTFS